MQNSPLPNNWFTEQCKDSGTAFSLQIKGLLHEETTPYQNIQIYDTQHFGNLMVIDGFIMLSQRDNFFYHEMMTHTALFTHPNPQQVVIIGGGDCGSLKEVLKHDTVQKATQIEIDEKVTQLAKEYFPELCQSNQDRRATLLFEDGITWMAQTPTQSLDIIIVDSTDPIGPAEGLFNIDFYKSCLKALKPNGILIQQSESPLIHHALLKAMHHAMHQAGFTHTQTLLFPQPVYPSGLWSATMASKNTPLSTFRKEEKQLTKLNTQYYTPTIHQGALETPPFVGKLIEELKG